MRFFRGALLFGAVLSIVAGCGNSSGEDELVLSLQGKFKDAETIARQDLSAEQAAQNTATLRAMLSQSNNWQKLRQMDGKTG